MTKEGAFLSPEWVGQLFLVDGQPVFGTLSLRQEDGLMGPRGNPVMESLSYRGTVRTTLANKGEHRDLFLAVHLR